MQLKVPILVKFQHGLAATHIISRTVCQASELKTVPWIKENPAVCELTGHDIEKVTKDKLYEIPKKLYEEKSGLENLSGTNLRQEEPAHRVAQCQG